MPLFAEHFTIPFLAGHLTKCTAHPTMSPLRLCVEPSDNGFKMLFDFVFCLFSGPLDGFSVFLYQFLTGAML